MTRFRAWKRLSPANSTRSLQAARSPVMTDSQADAFSGDGIFAANPYLYDYIHILGLLVEQV
jgi:hypothetical protein